MLIGHYICKIERMLNSRGIRCSNCKAWDKKKSECTIIATINGNHQSLDWQYCDFFDKKPKPKTHIIKRTCLNCSNLGKKVKKTSCSVTTGRNKHTRKVTWQCDSNCMNCGIPDKMGGLFNRTAFDNVPEVEDCGDFSTSKLTRFINNYRIWRD